MKSVGLLRVRDDLIRRCLFHPTAAAWEKVAALSQVGGDEDTACTIACSLSTPPPGVVCASGPLLEAVIYGVCTPPPATAATKPHEKRVHGLHFSTVC